MTQQELDSVVETVRAFADLLRQEFTREMRAYHQEQRQIMRELFRDLHTEFFAGTRNSTDPNGPVEPRVGLDGPHRHNESTPSSRSKQQW